MRLRSLVRSESGAALIFVLAFMAIAMPITAAALSLASTAALDSRVKTTTALSQYANLGGNQYGIWRLTEETGYADSLVAGVPDVQIISLNGEDLTVTWEKLAAPGGVPPAPGSSPLSTSKIVSASSIPADTPTALTYTIDVRNDGTVDSPVWRIRDGLPSGFSYQAGTTSGITTADPTIVVGGAGGDSFEYLTWDLSSQSINLSPTQSVSLQFDAIANAPDGVYCNTAWADPGGQSTGSGPTAIVTAGAGSGLCDAQALAIRKTVDKETIPSETPTTVTYSVEIENTGPSQVSLFWLRDILPAGVIFTSGSVGGDITSSNPFVWTSGGRQNLNWIFFFGLDIDPAETRTLTFDAVADLPSGVHQNEVWAFTWPLTNTAYSWPTADITVFDVFRVTTGDGTLQSSATLWLGQDDYTIKDWDVIQ